MTQVPQIDGIEINPADWAVTPVSIQALVVHWVAENQALKARLSRIEEQLGQNSQNSSKPPSQDGFAKKPEVHAKSTRNRGGQPGHVGNAPKFYDLSMGDVIENHLPTVCPICGEGLSGFDAAPYRHQVLELPKLRPQITEHRLHQLNCDHCGSSTRAKLPPEVSVFQYGERLTAAVGILSSENGQSHSKVQTLLNRLFGIDISIASVNRLRHEISDAVVIPVAAVQQFVKTSPLLHSDETSFTQGNGDGQNPDRKKAWVWTIVTTSVVIFEVA